MLKVHKMLNFICIIAFFFAIFSRETLQLQLESELDHHLNTIIELWRAGTIHHCSPVAMAVALPSMDVIRIPTYEGNLNQKGIKMKYATGEMQVVGLENTIVNNITTSRAEAEGEGLSASVDITIPALSFSSDNYQISGTAYFIYPIKGSGKLNITLYDVRIQGDIRLKPQENGTKVNDVTFKYSVGKVNAALQASTWPISSVLSREGATILSLYHAEITAAARKALTLHADLFLADIPPAVLLQRVADSADCANTLLPLVAFQS